MPLSKAVAFFRLYRLHTEPNAFFVGFQLYTALAFAMNSTISVLLFGIARDLTGQSTISVPLSAGANVGDLLTQLHHQYPALTGIRSLLVAVNGEYAEADQSLTHNDEIAIIPPVSGG